jgi:hypothetical protein
MSAEAKKGKKRKGSGDAPDAAPGSEIVSVGASTAEGEPFTPEEWWESVQYYRESGGVHGAQSAAAAKLGISVQLWRHHFFRFQQKGRLPRFRRGPDPYLTTVGEQAVVDFAKGMAKLNRPLPMSVLRAKAKQFARDNGLRFDMVGGDSWLSGFMSRHPDLSIRLPQEVERLRIAAPTTERLTRYFSLLQSAMAAVCKSRGETTFKPEWIFNVDEAPVGLRGLRQRVSTWPWRAPHSPNLSQIMSSLRRSSGRGVCPWARGATPRATT